MHTTIQAKYMVLVLVHLLFLLWTTILPKIRCLIDLFRLFSQHHSSKIYGPRLFTFSSVHDHSVKKIRSSLIHFFYFHTTTRPKYMVLFHIFFLLCVTIAPKIIVLIYSFFFVVFIRPFDQNICSFLIFFFFLLMTIRPKVWVLIDSFLYMYTTIWPKYMVLPYLFFLLCMTIRLAIRVLIVFFLCVLDYLTKIYGPF